MTDAASRPPDLARAREQVQAAIADAAIVQALPQASARYPLALLDPATETVLAARAHAGLRLPGDFPRRSALTRTVLPSAALAVVDLAGLIAAAVRGSTGLLIAAVVLFVVLALIALGGARFVAQDPLRLSRGQRSRVAAASTWESRADWTDGAGRAVERGAVIAAARAAERIARTPFWRGGDVGGEQAALDLTVELDSADAEARALAASGDAPDRAPRWAALVDRVAALHAYADQVDGFEHRRDAEVPLPSDAPAPSEGEVVALLAYLGAVRTG